MCTDSNQNNLFSSIGLLRPTSTSKLSLALYPKPFLGWRPQAQVIGFSIGFAGSSDLEKQNCLEIETSLKLLEFYRGWNCCIDGKAESQQEDLRIVIVLNSTGKGLSMVLLTEEKSISNGFRGCRVCYTPQVIYKISGAAGKEHSPETDKSMPPLPMQG